MAEEPTVPADTAPTPKRPSRIVASMAWLALLLCASFVVICLILIRPVVLTDPTAAQETFASRSAILVYGILLAGVIGSFLRYVVERFGSGSEPRPAAES